MCGNEKADDETGQETTDDVATGDVIELANGARFRVVEVTEWITEPDAYEVVEAGGEKVITWRTHHLENALVSGGRVVDDVELEEDDAGEEWSPEPASLREGETRDDAHARRNQEMIEQCREDLDVEEPDDVETDGGVAEAGGASDAEVREAVERSEAEGPELISDGGRVYWTAVVSCGWCGERGTRTIATAYKAGDRALLECARCRDETDHAVERVDVDDPARGDGDESEVMTDGGLVEDASGAEWCASCQRYRVSCAHSSELAPDGGDTTNVSRTSGVDMVEYEERAAELAGETSLTEGESRVAALKEQGLTHSEIADELGLAKSTIDENSRRITRRRREARRLLEELEDGVDRGEGIETDGGADQSADVIYRFKRTFDADGLEKCESGPGVHTTGLETDIDRDRDATDSVNEPACVGCGDTKTAFHDDTITVESRQPIDAPYGILTGAVPLCDNCARDVAAPHREDGCLICGGEATHGFLLEGLFGVEDLDVHYEGSVCDECSRNLVFQLMQMAANAQDGDGNV